MIWGGLDQGQAAADSHRYGSGAGNCPKHTISAAGYRLLRAPVLVATVNFPFVAPKTAHIASWRESVCVPRCWQIQQRGGGTLMHGWETGIRHPEKPAGHQRVNVRSARDVLP